MRANYVSFSLETHLFFGRIMKEHALFLLAGFPAKNEDYIQKADWFRMQFEELLCKAVHMAQNRLGEEVLSSGELFTDFTIGAEKKTSFLTGIEIDSTITQMEKELCAANRGQESMEKMREVRSLNQAALGLVDGLIDFKERILKDMADCQIFTFNYPLLVEHILREAKLYRCLIWELEHKGTLSRQNRRDMEVFWNQIMMEHALFIRGLLDPSEENLIDTADEFAEEYKKLLEEARNKDCRMMEDLCQRTWKKTVQYRDFKASGAKGILQCQIAGLIVPLLADHVLREANHYLRLLEEEC